MDDETYQRLKTAVEIGKWPNGTTLKDEQRQISLQAVIAYELKKGFPEEKRTGFVDTSVSGCDPFADVKLQTQYDDEQPLKWK